LLIDVPALAVAISLVPTLGWPPVAGLGLAVTGLHTWAVLDPRAGLYGPVRWRLPRGSPGIALTFDDGPNPETTPRVLDRLAAAGCKGTFFVVGEHVRKHPHLIRRMVGEGHAIGLHSDRHARTFPFWLPGRMIRDLQANADAIAQTTGAPPPRLFRPPMGIKNPFVGHAAACLHLTTVTWTATGRDGVATTAERALARLLPSVKPRSILVLHDGCEPGRHGDRSVCLAVLDRLLADMAQRGLPGVVVAG
jgi:peptidoglycan/xylan/chitin deacetylase (PgdA/CDA1 family)